jgi:hypothetical protein
MAHQSAGPAIAIGILLAGGAAAEPAPPHLVQVRMLPPAPHPMPMPMPAPIPNLGRDLTPSIGATPVAPGPVLTPGPVITAPPVTVAPPPPPPPAIRARPSVPPACIVASLSTGPYASCTTRYIEYRDFYRELRACESAHCFSRVFLALERTPTVVVYPDDHWTARAAIETEVRFAANAMGEHLKQRVYSGAAGLPSVAQINGLVSDAISRIDAINQPVTDSLDERLKRLGLSSSLRALARNVANS